MRPAAATLSVGSIPSDGAPSPARLGRDRRKMKLASGTLLVNNSMS